MKSFFLSYGNFLQRRRWLMAVLCFLVPTGSFRAETGIAEGWSKIETFRFNDALKAFKEADPSADARERDFGEAIALLNRQPRSDANLIEALRLLEGLSKKKENDSLDALSLYYIGRIYQLHLEETDREKALEAYHAVLRLHSGNPLAEMAATSIVFMEMYGNKAKEKPLDRLKTLEMLLNDIQNDLARREFHTAMGFAYLEFAEKDDREMLRKAVAHLKEADRIGVTRWQAESALWVAIGEASRELGDRNTALEYYQKFLDTYKRDRRNDLIRERMAEMKQKDSK